MTEQTCAPTLRRLWAEGGQGRQRWWRNAYDRFCNDLSAWTRDSLPAARDETTIVLFGPTQVGKTTLLLELLGVAEASLPHVNDVLRGGRGAGLSATAMPMIYDESPGELWRLNHEERGLDDEEVKQALAQIRERVEAGLADTRPATLHIPARYFKAGRHDAPRLRILDLPGVNPGNANEAKHVRRVAEEYVPTADLVLLITKADHLGFLQPETLTAGEVGAPDGTISPLRALDWTVSPSRFCIVTTYAFTLGTLRDWLCKPGETRDVAALRARLAEQMRTFDGMRVEDLPPLYPLDFGTSWSNTPVERRTMVEPLMAELRHELLQRIAESAQPLGRLRQARDAYHVAVKVQEAERERHIRAQEAGKGEMAQRAKRLENWRQQSKRRCECLRALPDAAMVEQACQHLLDEISKMLDDVPTLLPAVNDKEAMKKSCLLSVARQFQMSLRRCVSKLEMLAPDSDETCEILKRVIAGFNEKQFSGHLATFFTKLERRLDGYVFDDYWLVIPGRNFTEDRAWLSTCMEESRVWTQSSLGKACRGAARARQEILARQRERMGHGLQRVQARIKRLEDEQTMQQAELVKRADKTAAIKRELDEDIKRATQFDALLRAALLDDLRARRETLVKEPVPARRFLRLLEAVSVINRAHTLLDSSPTTTESAP